jgi:flagellar hook-associated protein 2
MTISQLGATSATQATAAASTAHTGTTSTSTSGTSSTSAVGQAVKVADARLQSRLDTAKVQLSSLGKLKAAVSDMQLTARALSALKGSASGADVKAALGSFTSAFNGSMAAAGAATTAMSTGDATGTRRVGNDLRRGVSADAATADALRKIGIKQQPDGSLSVDATKLDAALTADPAGAQAALAKLGQAADATATKELATGGHVANPLAALSKHAATLKTQQSALLAMAPDTNTTASTTASSSLISQGLSAYTAGY